MDEETAHRIAAPLTRYRDPAAPLPYACPAVMARNANPLLTTLAEFSPESKVFLMHTRSLRARKLAAAHGSALPIAVHGRSKEDLERFCARVDALGLDVTFLPMRQVGGALGSHGSSRMAFKLSMLEAFRTSTRSAPGQWQPRAVLFDEAVLTMGHTLTRHLQGLVEVAGAPETFRVHKDLYDLLDELRATHTRRHGLPAPF